LRPQLSPARPWSVGRTSPRTRPSRRRPTQCVIHSRMNRLYRALEYPGEPCLEREQGQSGCASAARPRTRCARTRCAGAITCRLPPISADTRTPGPRDWHPADLSASAADAENGHTEVQRLRPNSRATPECGRTLSKGRVAHRTSSRAGSEPLVVVAEVAECCQPLVRRAI
jgi:hypothetical protein